MIRVLLTALLVAAAPAAFADLYKCVDAKGKTQYSDKPLPGCKATADVKAEPAGTNRKTSARPRPPSFNERDNFAREQVVRCGQARQAAKRGDASESVRETLRDCM
jgi:hypothetical protein